MSYFAAEIESGEICIVDMAVEFPGVPAAPSASIETELQTALGEDDLGIQLSEDLEIDVGVVSVALSPSAGIANLDFVDHMAITVGAAESPIPNTLVVSLSKDDRLDDGALYAQPASAVDVSAHIRAGELVLDFAISGELPKASWQATTDLCLSAAAGYVAPL